MDTQFVPEAPSHAEGKAQRRRAGKACQYCHARKIRCDVQRCGVPCSNCVNQSISCTIRRRKNARSGSDATELSLHQPPIKTGFEVQNEKAYLPGIQHIESAPTNGSPTLSFDAQNRPVEWVPSPEQWNNLIAAQSPVVATNQTPSAGVDFTYLNDLEDVFAFTDWSLLPGSQQPGGQPMPALRSFHSDPSPVQSSPALSGIQNFDAFDRVGFLNSTARNSNDQQFLKSQGCYSLPPIHILRQILGYYFQYVQPNLPIIDEHRFESLWTHEDYRLDGFSFFVFRTMLFAAIHFVDVESLAALGYSGKRDARLAYLRQAKLVFDFGLETDPIANAQGCLLLTYYAPGYNKLRVNGSWLMSAARFAKIAHADAFHLIQDPVRRRTSKRLWWGILFRDRILSLGLRWTLQVPLNPRFESNEYFLNVEDFESDLGNSKVHDRNSQLRIIDIVTSMCSLVCQLTPVLQLLYGYERARERIASVASSVQTSITEIQSGVDRLQRWYERVITIFPEPIGLDDTQESVCLFANLMFCYYSSAVFALNLHRILIHVALPASRDRISLEACQEASVIAINDLGKRTQELVQSRLARFIPISASAYMALPLLLQAVDVVAVRGTELETVEARKLDIFSRVLRGQEQNFDGSEFCREILSNIVAYVQNDESFLDWIETWRDERDERDGNEALIAVNHNSNPARKSKLGWANLILKQPRLYLRLLLNLDFTLCTGGAPKEEDLLPELLRVHSR